MSSSFMDNINKDETTIKYELLKTLEYYFSSRNLAKDEYLLSQMDNDYLNLTPFDYNIKVNLLYAYMYYKVYRKQ